MEDDQAQLFARALDAAMRGDDADFAMAATELADTPVEPGDMRIEFPSMLQQFDITGACERCGRLVRTAGIAFTGSDIDLRRLAIISHQARDCRAWRSRLVRLRRATIGEVRRRIEVSRWRRWRAEKRSDPAEWLRYWTEVERRRGH